MSIENTRGHSVEGVQPLDVAETSEHAVASAATVPSHSNIIDRNPERFWQTFGFTIMGSDESGCLTATLPDGMIGITSSDNEALINCVKVLSGPPFYIVAGDRSVYLYGIEDGSALPDVATGITLLRAGDTITLPAGTDFRSDLYRCQSIKDLPVLASSESVPAKPEKVLPPVMNTPLSAFSLRGQATKFEEEMVKAEPVLGDLCLAGQSTIWYAAPNAGKTLIALRLLMDAVVGGRVAAGNVYYINADDGNEGFATKLRLLDDLGAHTLSPGLAGFEARDLSALLREMADTSTAVGTVVIVDTLKKFVDLMDKKGSSAFGDAVRRYVMKGGTFLGLAHTNKNASATGKAVYAGVADIVQDADAAYTMSVLDDFGEDECVVQFEVLKRRGPAVAKVAYAYASAGGLSYEERLASTRVVDPRTFDEFERFRAEKSDEYVIAAITACIGEGVVQKMALAKAASLRAHVPERAAIRVLEAYTGDDPTQHRWTYRVRARGAKVYELHVKPVALAA